MLYETLHDQQLMQHEIEIEIEVGIEVGMEIEVGIEGYRALEQVKERKAKYQSRESYDEATDWFSLGTTCYALLFGKNPFLSKTEIAKLVESGEYSDLTSADDMDTTAIPKASIDNAEIKALMLAVKYPKDLESVPKNFLERLMNRDATKRLNYQGINQLEFFKELPFDPTLMASREPNKKIMAYINSNFPDLTLGEPAQTTPQLASPDARRKCINLEHKLYGIIG